MKERERLIQEALIETDKKLIDKSKQIPQKPIMIGDEYGLSHCPNCGDSKYILFGDKYCIECGQRLEWSDVK